MKIGDKVTVTEEIEAYYSGYAGNPEVIIKPGQIGTVKSVHVPSLWREKGFFNYVDFIIPGVFNGDRIHNNCTWRIAAQDKQLKIIN